MSDQVSTPQEPPFKTASDKIKDYLQRGMKDTKEIAKQVDCSETLVRKVQKRMNERLADQPSTGGVTTIESPTYAGSPPPLEKPPQNVAPPTKPIPPFEIDIDICKSLQRLPYELAAQLLKCPSIKLNDPETETGAKGIQQALNFYLPQYMGDNSRLGVLVISQLMVMSCALGRYISENQPKQEQKGEASKKE